VRAHLWQVELGADGLPARSGVECSGPQARVAPQRAQRLHFDEELWAQALALANRVRSHAAQLLGVNGAVVDYRIGEQAQHDQKLFVLPQAMVGGLGISWEDRALSGAALAQHAPT